MTEIELIEILTKMQDRLDRQERDIDTLAELVQRLLEKIEYYDYKNQTNWGE